MNNGHFHIQLTIKFVSLCELKQQKTNKETLIFEWSNMNRGRHFLLEFPKSDELRFLKQILLLNAQL